MIPFLYFLALSMVALIIHKTASWQYHKIEKKMEIIGDQPEKKELKKMMDDIQMIDTIIIVIISIFIGISFIATLIAFYFHLLTYI